MLQKRYIVLQMGLFVSLAYTIISWCMLPICFQRTNCWSRQSRWQSIFGKNMLYVLTRRPQCIMDRFWLLYVSLSLLGWIFWSPFSWRGYLFVSGPPPGSQGERARLCPLADSQTNPIIDMDPQARSTCCNVSLCLRWIQVSGRPCSLSWPSS